MQFGTKLCIACKLIALQHSILVCIWMWQKHGNGSWRIYSATKQDFGWIHFSVPTCVIKSSNIYLSQWKLNWFKGFLWWEILSSILNWLLEGITSYQNQLNIQPSNLRQMYVWLFLCLSLCTCVSPCKCVCLCGWVRARACVFDVWISRRKIQRARGWVFLEERELGLRKVFFEDPWDEKDDENSFVFCCYKGPCKIWCTAAAAAAAEPLIWIMESPYSKQRQKILKQVGPIGRLYKDKRNTETDRETDRWGKPMGLQKRRRIMCGCWA